MACFKCGTTKYGQPTAISKVDDSYDTDDAIVQVDKNGEPVIIEMFNGKSISKN